LQKIILIAGPSGAGKTTISEYLTKKFGIPRVITHTTRPMRPGEVANKSYYFENNASFSKLHFFEHVRYGSYQYGSSKEALARAWKKNDIASLIVNIEGAASYIKQLGKQVYFLYVTTSTRTELKERLLKRGDNPKKIAERLSGNELNLLPDNLKRDAHIILNDNWNKTKKKLNAIIAGLQAS